MDATPRSMRIEHILGRSENAPDVTEPLEHLRTKVVLITGAFGSIGGALGEVLTQVGSRVVEMDLPKNDVRDLATVSHFMWKYRPDVIFHYAAAKSAPDGELNPYETADTNIRGTANVLSAAPKHARIVTASTCKACDPETAYGASKLIAERMTLNSGQSVARFFNVVETSGNVFELWEKQEVGALPVCPATRYFISLREAVYLSIWAATLDPGRYILSDVEARSMADVAVSLYPGKAQTEIPLRRGDRQVEPFVARSEKVRATLIPGIARVTSPYEGGKK